MNRVNPHNVVEAYKVTKLIPIRKAWTTTDTRGACAFDALARASTDMNGDEYSKAYFDEVYIKGFIEAWDADTPLDIIDKDEKCNMYLTGFWDAMVCRDVVTMEFDSVAVVEASQ
jgi:hypothetical protein